MIELISTAGVGSENDVIAIRLLDVAPIRHCFQIGIGAADEHGKIRLVGIGNVRVIESKIANRWPDPFFSLLTE